MSYLPARSAPRRGFTLVELLVVIGIIAVLISVLLPVVGKARESANQVVCQANVRSIVQAMTLHAETHQGYMPLAGAIMPGNTPHALQDDDRERYEYFLDDSGILQVMSVEAALATSLGQPIRNDSRANVEADTQKMSYRKFFLCPSDRDGGRYGTTLGGGTNAFSSYAFNEAPLGWADPGQLNVRDHSRLRGFSLRFPNASTLMLVTDGAPRGGDGSGHWQVYYDHDLDCTLRDVYLQNESENPNARPGVRECGAWNLIDTNRHRGRISVGFADGHAENVHITEGDLDKISLDVGFPIY